MFYAKGTALNVPFYCVRNATGSAPEAPRIHFTDGSGHFLAYDSKTRFSTVFLIVQLYFQKRTAKGI